MPPRVMCLIADDREENLRALSLLLRRDDVEVLQARSAGEALELLQAHDVALALLDVQMPDMDGFELAERMRGNEGTRYVPIIFVTAGAQDQHRLFKGYETGAVDFLYKPIDPRILKNKADVFIQLEQQKQQLAQELRDRTDTLRLHEMFTAVLGHDLRNPLNAILTAAQLLQQRSQDDAVRRTAASMRSSAERMSRLIEDLLDLARARLAGGIPLTRGRADAGALVHRVVLEHQAAFPERRIDVRCEGDLTGEWDADRLAQVASNLIGNALRHGDSGEAVEVRLQGTSADAVALSVANAGSISADLLPHVFDPFRAGERPIGHNGSLGLGLFIVQQIVEAHEGRIDVQSAASRTVFRLSIPRRARETAKP